MEIQAYGGPQVAPSELPGRVHMRALATDRRRGLVHQFHPPLVKDVPTETLTTLAHEVCASLYQEGGAVPRMHLRQQGEKPQHNQGGI